MEMKRFEEFDIARGFAILLVYLGHSFLYYPIALANMYTWCAISTSAISSFNMPLFFIISGYLFAYNKRPSFEIFKNKVLRLFIPYTTVMIILILPKLFLPSALMYRKVSGLGNMLSDSFLYGYDRWFVYVLFLMFILMILIRKPLNNKFYRWVMLLLSVGLASFISLPTIFSIDKIIYFSFFFLFGFIVKDYSIFFDKLKINIYLKIGLYLLFILCNIVFVRILLPTPMIGKYILPLIGSVATITLSHSLSIMKIASDNIIVRYIKYAGKYALQFYLLTFAFPIIRYIVINILHTVNPFMIVSIMFIMQLICITIIVEVTKRIKFLKIPLGY